MVQPDFKYHTYIDRVITDEKYNILFGENPGNVYDEISEKQQKDMIKNQDKQIKNQQMAINKLHNQLGNQEIQIANQEITVEKLEKQLDAMGDALTAMLNVEEASGDVKDAVTDMADKLDKTLDVEIVGNSMRLYGTSDDDKPDEDDLDVGTTFFETDTGDAYIYTGDEWVEL